MGRRRHSEHRRRSKLNILIIITGLLIVGVSAVIICNYAFRITTINITGSERYTYDQLYKSIFEDRNSKNMLAYLYTDRKAEPVEIPFISQIDVDVEWPDTLNITVYEKSITGYVMYKGNYMYFDKDGVVVESSSEKVEGVPMVEGLDFSSIVLYSKLEIQDSSIFSTILNITQSLEKYDISVDKIEIGDDKQLYLYVGNVKVNLGTEEDIGEKIYGLSRMISKFNGLSGTLFMEKYNEDTSSVRFKSDE